MDQIIENAFIQYHDSSISIPAPLTENISCEYIFGIMKLKVKKDIPISLPHQHFVFSIDKSGSMSYQCNDHKTKLEHIQFTLENMIRLFLEVDTCSISIHINTFDSHVVNCIYNTKVNQSNKQDIINKIRRMIPESCTNIEAALRQSKEDIKQYQKENPTHEVSHIFLTDGVPTNGSKNIMMLKKQISDDYPNIFIGYGSDHDPYLMTELSNCKNGAYYFIDALEKSSFVYGEIIHNLLKKVSENTIIKMNDAEIYNYNTNNWETELYVGNLILEKELIFQVRSLSEKYKGSSFTVSNSKTKTNYYPISINTNCIPYMFRQYTQELLFEMKECIFSNQDEYINSIYNKQNIGLELFKNKISTFLKFMMNYIKDNNLKNDKFMKMLCDDLYISYQTIGTQKVGIFTCARQTSQGRQTTYNVSLNDDFDDFIVPICPTETNILNEYKLSDHIDSPYATQGVIDTINMLSQVHDL